MSSHAPTSSPLFAPVRRIGRTALAGLAYLGGMAILAGAAVRSLGRRNGSRNRMPLGRAVGRQVTWLIAMGLPLVGLVHVGLGSFLSMQAFFGGTFADGTGAVVGVGLVRNIAPLMSGLTLAGLLAARLTSELRSRSRRDPDSEPGWAPDRDRATGAETAPDPGRLTAVRVVAAMIAGPVLATWGALVGTLVGWLVSMSLVGVTTNSFFHLFFEMVWVRDVVGVLVKGLAFGFFSALFACYEGLREPVGAEADLDSVTSAACRAACGSAVAILMINNTWFTLLYLSGPAFGPTFLAPPAS